MARKKSSHPIELILIEKEALNDLDSLVQKGCDRDSLLALLDNLQWGKKNKSWESLAGTDDTRNLTALTERITRLAVEIIVLNKTPMMTVFGRFMAGTGSRDLPAMLIRYAATLEALRRVAGPRSHSLEELTRCLLIAYVRARTGCFHDEEVSGLISAVTNKLDYDATAHKGWRQSHRRAVEVALETLKKFPK